MTVDEALRARRSIKNFDPEHTLDDATLSELMSPVMLTPSSFNLQHWRFVVVRDAEVQEAVCQAAYGQAHVRDCSAVIIVTAKKDAHLDATTIWDTTDAAQRIADIANDFYGGDEQRMRDEALRSGGLASMALMLKATEMGLGTCPMIGFDQAELAAVLRIPADHVCVMMICVGKIAKPARPRVHRYSISQVVSMDTFDGKGLGE